MKRILLMAWMAGAVMLGQAMDFRGSQFIAVTNFSGFVSDGRTMRSAFLKPSIAWNELVVSWNMVAAEEKGLRIEVECAGAVRGFADWRLSTNRTSLPSKWDGGEVDTDTLKLAQPTNAAIRLIVTMLDGAAARDLKFIGLSFRDSTAQPEPLEPNRAAWGRVIEVATRSQLDYPEGAKIWCSPTSTSMILDYWARALQRPELTMSVREAARAVHDVAYKGTGNWPFNTALAGSFAGLRGYVSRLTDVSELEDWIAAGIPIVTSVSYNRLKGRGTSGSGHLIVCVGFAENGDVIVNDPGTQLSNVRRQFSRGLFRQAWADSGNTVYIIYPESAAIPEARFGHWEARAQ